jgi:predicted small lipoprotein YifL
VRPIAAFALLALLATALAACGQPPPYAALPPDAVTGGGDPTRSAILRASHALAAPGSPAEAARTIAQLEYLAVELRHGPRWTEFNPQVTLDFAAAREEWRGALGIAPEAPPQPVIDALYSVARGTPALAAPAFPHPETTLARLAALPPLPRTVLAAARARDELNRVDQFGRTNPGRGRSGGRGA